MKRSTKTTLRNKADKFLQEYIRLKYKDILCYACEEKLVTVGHHFVPVGNSNALRYCIPNIIPLCRDCHCKVHTQPHLVNPKICFLMGKDWYEKLMKIKQQFVKTNLIWYQDKFDKMQELYSVELSRREI